MSHRELSISAPDEGLSECAVCRESSVWEEGRKKERRRPQPLPHHQPTAQRGHEKMRGRRVLTCRISVCAGLCRRSCEKRTSNPWPFWSPSPRHPPSPWRRRPSRPSLSAKLTADNTLTQCRLRRELSSASLCRQETQIRVDDRRPRLHSREPQNALRKRGS